jgi:hypothetical protein
MEERRGVVLAPARKAGSLLQGLRLPEPADTKGPHPTLSPEARNRAAYHRTNLRQGPVAKMTQSSSRLSVMLLLETYRVTV